jgi:hypothetical protein
MQTELRRSTRRGTFQGTGVRHRHDAVLTISDAGVKSSSISTLSELGWAAFPPPDPSPPPVVGGKAVGGSPPVVIGG